MSSPEEMRKKYLDGLNCIAGKLEGVVYQASTREIQFLSATLMELVVALMEKEE